MLKPVTGIVADNAQGAPWISCHPARDGSSRSGIGSAIAAAIFSVAPEIR